MNLIIKIDDDIAKGIRGENECEVEPREIVRSFQATIADAIKNGTPVSTDGDLISRGVAINLLNEAQVEYDEYYKGLGKAKTIIDNAPPVETYTKDDMTREYLKGYNACKDMNERPQGEWEDYSADFYKCPECGYLLNKLCPQCYNKVILPKGGKKQ